MPKNKHTVKGLNQLLSAYAENKKLFSFLADQEREVNQIRYFNTQSTLRNKFSNDIRSLLRALGEKPKTKALRPGFLNNWDQMIDELMTTAPERLHKKALKRDAQAIAYLQELLKDDLSFNEEDQRLLHKHLELLAETQSSFVHELDELANSGMELLS